jgi:hypothetical protein
LRPSTPGALAKRLVQERPELKNRHYAILVTNEDGDEIGRIPLDIIHREVSMKEKSEEQERIQKKQGGHHMPPRPEDGPPLDDTDRNTDKVIKPSSRKP